MKVCIIHHQHVRSRRIADALVSGASAMGWKSPVVTQFLDESLTFDLVAGYGWCHEQFFETYRKKDTPYIYIDLGYWYRKQYASDYNGYHKCVLNARHPTKYYRKFKRDSNRLNIDAPAIQPWRKRTKNGHILLAGMSAKGAVSVGLPPMQWERRTVEKIKKATKRNIIYRPKPSWRTFTEIDGTFLSIDPQPISDVLVNCHAVVTYYSNASFDAIAAGIPIYTVEGAAKVVSMPSIEEIEDTEPYMDFDRQQLFQDISYCHFTKNEIANGSMFRQFVEDGLI